MKLRKAIVSAAVMPLLVAAVTCSSTAPAQATTVRKTVVTIQTNHYYFANGAEVVGIVVVAEGLGHQCVNPHYTVAALASAKLNAINGVREGLSCPNIGFSHIIDGYRYNPTEPFRTYTELRARVGTTHHYLCTPQPTPRSGTTRVTNGFVQWTRSSCLATIV